LEQETRIWLLEEGHFQLSVLNWEISVFDGERRTDQKGCGSCGVGIPIRYEVHEGPLH
jgi:hypothetical protein